MLDKPEPTKKVIFYKGVSQSMDSKHFRFLPDKSAITSTPSYSVTQQRSIAPEEKSSMPFSKTSGMVLGRKSRKVYKISTWDAMCRRSIILLICCTKSFTIFGSTSGKTLIHLRLSWRVMICLLDPAGMLPKYCKAVGIPYNDSLLSWDANPDITDIWKCAFMPVKDFEFIRIFCHNAFHTSHFLPPPPILP